MTGTKGDGEVSYSSNSVRNMRSTWRIHPGPSALHAASTSGDRDMVCVTLRSPSAMGGRPRRRLGWLVMLGDPLPPGVALILSDQPVIFSASLELGAEFELAFCSSIRIKQRHHGGAAFVGAELENSVGIGAVRHLANENHCKTIFNVNGVEVDTCHLHSPPLFSEAPDRHPLPMNYHYNGYYRRTRGDFHCSDNYFSRAA